MDKMSKVFWYTWRSDGLKGVAWIALQLIRMKIFWTRDMKPKRVNTAMRLLGRAVFNLQNKLA